MYSIDIAHTYKQIILIWAQQNIVAQELIMPERHFTENSEQRIDQKISITYHLFEKYDLSYHNYI